MLDVCAQGISLSAYTVCRKMLSKNPRTRAPPDAHRDIALYNACAVRSRQTDAVSTLWQTRNLAKLAAVISRT